MSTTKLSELNTFSDRLNFLRGNKSKALFAKEIGISPPLFSQWEHGASPTYDKVRLIAERLGKSVDWLLNGSEQPDHVQEKSTDWKARALDAERKLKSLRAAIKSFNEVVAGLEGAL